jgi:hypothetical protein
LIERHESLRTRLDITECVRQQIIDQTGTFHVETYFSGDDPDQVSATLRPLQDRSFELSAHHGWSGAVLLNEQGVPHRFAICLHHVLVDWYGMNQLGLDFTALVGHDDPVRQNVLDRPRLRPSDLAVAQRSAQWRERRQRSLRHWGRVLDEIGPLRPPARPSPGRIDLYLRSPEMARALQVITRRYRVTAQSVLLALTALVVAAVSRTRLPVLNFTVSNRHDHEWREIVANLAQGMLLPVHLDPVGQSFTELTRDVQQRALTCMRHAFFDPDELTALLSEHGMSAPAADYQFNHLALPAVTSRNALLENKVVKVEPQYRIGPRLRIWTVTSDVLQITLMSDPSLVPQPAARQILYWFQLELTRLAGEPSTVREMIYRLDLGQP